MARVSPAVERWTVLEAVSRLVASPRTNSTLLGGYCARPGSMGCRICSSLRTPGMTARMDAMFQ